MDEYLKIGDNEYENVVFTKNCIEVSYPEDLAPDGINCFVLDLTVEQIKSIVEFYKGII